MTTWTPQATNRSWFSIAISSDSKYQTAVVNGDYIYRSDDYGITWSPVGISNAWRSVRMSSTGQYQTAVGDSSEIYRSINYGITWVAATSGHGVTWVKLAMSSNGQYQTAVAEYDYIHQSTNYGVTWNHVGLNLDWTAIGMSADGKYQTAGAYNNILYRSTDYGATWNSISISNRGWRSISISSTGKYQTTCPASNLIMVSNDYGITWTPVDSSRNWAELAISGNGKFQVAVVGASGQIYQSSNYGLTWVPEESNRNWKAIAMSSDNHYQVAAVVGGQIYETTIPLPPIIDTQPTNQKVKLGDTLNLSVIAHGSGIIHYQWKKNGNNVGTDSSSYSKNNFTDEDRGTYTVDVTNDIDTTVSNEAAVTVNPNIIIQPITESVIIGGTLSLSVIATGHSPITYQWNKEGIPISGKTKALLIITPYADSDHGSYTCDIICDENTVVSDSAIISTRNHDAIHVQMNGIIIGGSLGNLAFYDDSIGTISWQWKIGTHIFSTVKNPVLGNSITDYLTDIINIGGTDYLPVTLSVNEGAGLKTQNIEIIWVV